MASTPHLSHAGQGAVRQLPMLSGSDGTGVGYGQGIHAHNQRDALTQWFRALSDRLRFVRIAMGSWERVLTPAVTTVGIRSLHSRFLAAMHMNRRKPAPGEDLADFLSGVVWDAIAEAER